MTLITDPFPRNLDYNFSFALMGNLKGGVTIGFAFGKFINNIGPAATSNIYAFLRINNPQEIRFALHQSDRKAVNGKNIKRF